MLKNLFVRTKTVVAALCVSVLLTASLGAQELKPFLTLKLADPATLLSVAEKIADLAGQRREFDAGVASFRDLDGINKKGPLGLILQTNGDEIQSPIVVLPLEDLDKLSFPHADSLREALQKEDDKYVINSPLGPFHLYQKKGFALITSASNEAPLPEDPAQFFAGLENYTLGMRFDFGNTSLESIEILLAPLQMMLATQGEEAAQAAQQISDQMSLLHKEYQSVSGGIVFDPKTAAVDYVVQCIPKSDSNVAKMMEAVKDMKSSFTGFTSAAPDAIFSLSSAQYDASLDGEMLQQTMNAVDQLIDGILEQFSEQSESDEDFALAESVAESLRTVLESTLKKGNFDSGMSMDASGTILFAMNLAETDELKKIYSAIVDHLRSKDVDVDAAAKYLTTEYKTIEGFKISSFVVPFADLPTDDVSPALMGKTLSIYWAIKDNEAAALALGLDAKATEEKFRAALEKTKSTAPVPQPPAFLAIQPLGKLLDKYMGERDETATKVLKTLLNAPTDAKLTLSISPVGEGFEAKYSATGSCVATLVELFKALANAKDEESDEIREF